MRNLLISITAGVLLAILLLGPATAGADAKLKSLLQELDALIEKAESGNLADPWFLQDLRALSGRYGQTWPKVLLDHRFDAKGNAPKAPWQVRQGQMKMDWSRGLRSRVEVEAAQPAGAARDDKEIVGQVVGSLLSKALGSQGAKKAPATPAPDPTLPAVAVAAVPVTNAFQMTAELTARAIPGADRGAFEMGVTQAGDAGYRLSLAPRAEGGAVFTLTAVSTRGGERVVERAVYDQAIGDDQPLSVTLSRRPDGTMAAAVGDRELFAARDRSFQDAFTGVMIANRGGDYAVRSMTVRGAE